MSRVAKFNIETAENGMRVYNYLRANDGAENSLSVDPASIFPGFGDMNPAQQGLICLALDTKIPNSVAGYDADDVVEKMRAQAERLVNGEYTSPRSSGGPRMSNIVRALHAAKQGQGVDVSLEEIAENFAALSKDERSAVRKHPLVEIELQKIKDAEAKEHRAELKRRLASDEAQEALPF